MLHIMFCPREPGEEETKEHILWCAWESDGSGYKKKNNITHTYMHTHASTYIFWWNV